jgi:hypothetical protein
MPDNSVFPIQEPMRNRDEVQFAINVLKTCFTDYIKHGEQLVMTVEVRIEDQTKKQRGGCALWFEDIASATGCTAKAARMFCMQEFFSPVIHEAMGEELVSIRSFGDISKAETRSLMDQMEPYFAEKNIPLRTLKQQ